MIGIVQLFTLILAIGFCDGSDFGPKDVNRAAGTDDEYIRCRPLLAVTPPIWKINGIVYYYSEVPPPFVSRNGREIYIAVIDLFLNGTSFQCFVPSSAGDLISSSIGILTVRENDHSQVLDGMYSNMSQSRLVIAHEHLDFSYNSLKLAWRAISSETCTYFDLIAKYGCDASNNNIIDSEVIVNKTQDDSVVLQREDLPGGRNTSVYFTISSYNEEGNPCADLFLEPFQFDAEILTEEVHLCRGDDFDHSDTCTSISTCVEVPPLNGRQTLTLALPYLPTTTRLEDLLCPVHPLLGDICVDLLSCNRFRESAYANSITICRMSNSSTLEMCFHNITNELNGVRLHFFYSDLHCNPTESTRFYTKSIQLQINVTNIEDTLELNVTTLNDSETCITSKCNQGCKISIVDRFSCTDYINIDQNATKRSCISLATLHSVMDMACAPYHVKVDSGNMTIYSTSIMEVQDFSNGSVVIPMSSSKCTCYSSQSARSTSRGLAIAVCSIIIGLTLTLLLSITVVAYRNYRIMSQ